MCAFFLPTFYLTFCTVLLSRAWQLAQSVLSLVASASLQVMLQHSFVFRLIHRVIQGIAVTSDILITIAVFGAIFDAIEGAVIRSKLRDSINKVGKIRCYILCLCTDTSTIPSCSPIASSARRC